MAARKPQVITLRRSTAVRTGIVAAVLAALAVGFAMGLGISSTAAPPTDAVVVAATTTSHGSPVTRPGLLPTVRSCGSRSTSQVRPTRIYIGCASGDISITTITWSHWGSAGSGSGTLNVNNCQPNCATGSVSSSPAFVVVSNPVAGVYQDVLITPPSGALTPQSSSQPGSGWGSG